MLFIPGYLALNLIYGAEISRELTPLWVLGPLIVAVNIKLLQALCALSIYSIKRTIGLVKNIPNYFKAICGLLRDHLWHSVVSIVSLDYRVLLKQKLRQLQEVAYEKYLDLIESVWPYYCPTIRALKKALLL